MIAGTQAGARLMARPRCWILVSKSEAFKRVPEDLRRYGR